VSTAERIQAAKRALADPALVVELREGSTPSQPWRTTALGFVATVIAASSLAGHADARQGGGQTMAVAPPPVKVMIDGKQVEMLHPMERVRLCKMVAAQAALKTHGLDWRDLYAVVHAETGWAPRDGVGRNGRVSRGLAQLEDATAQSLGVADSNDPKQALDAVAQLLKEGAGWSRARGLAVANGALSVHYNLSTKARNAWNGVSTESLPLETQRHIANFAQGKVLADRLEHVWTAQQRRLARGHANRVADSRNHLGVDGSAEMQRMKGFAGSSLKPADLPSQRQQTAAVQQAADRSGLRSPEIGLDQLRLGVAALIERIKSAARAHPHQVATETPSTATATATKGFAAAGHRGRVTAPSEPLEAMTPAAASRTVAPAHATRGQRPARWATATAAELRRVAAREVVLVDDSAGADERRRGSQRPRGG